MHARTNTHTHSHILSRARSAALLTHAPVARTHASLSCPKPFRAPLPHRSKLQATWASLLHCNAREDDGAMFVAVAVGVAVWAESCNAVVDAACAAVEAAVRRTSSCFMTSCWKSARATSRESRALITCCVKDTVLRDSLSVRATLNPTFETLEHLCATQQTTARCFRHLRQGVANAGRRERMSPCRCVWYASVSM